MTFYEQELRKLFADGTVIGSPKFTGRACLGTLGKDLRVRVQFVTSGHADHYDAISITVLVNPQQKPRRHMTYQFRLYIIEVVEDTDAC